MFHNQGAEVGDLQQRLRDFTAELWRFRVGTVGWNRKHPIMQVTWKDPSQLFS